MTLTLNSYQKILSQVQKTIRETEQNIVQNVNRQKVEMCWKLGKIIDEHLLKNDRADYGKKFFQDLSTDIAIAEKTLYQMRSFYKTYPTLPQDNAALSWSHYRNLISVKNDETRKYLEDLTVTKNLDTKELQSKISKSKPRAKSTAKSPKNSSNKKLKFERGKLFTYKLKKFSDSPSSFVDCGFSVFTEIKTSFKTDGEIVTSVKKSGGFGLRKFSGNAQRLHTYKATLERVVDGDTIHITLDLGFKIRHSEILRLAKINAAESSTAAGAKATATLRQILKDVPFLIVKTNKTDIYGRYIADVFFADKNETDPQKVANSGIYLNQLLLDRRLVELY